MKKIKAMVILFVLVVISAGCTKKETKEHKTTKKEATTATQTATTTAKEKTTTTTKKKAVTTTQTTAQTTTQTTAQTTTQTTEKQETMTTAKVKKHPSTNRQKSSTKKSEKTTGKEKTTTKKAAQCTLLISAKTVLSHKSDLQSNYQVPKNGSIAEKTMKIAKGDTALSLLKKTKIAVDTSKGYVSGIDGLYEFDCGNQSGWMYQVNGKFPNVSAGEYQVNDGDRVAWLYTCKRGDI